MKKIKKILFVETKSNFFYPYQNWYFPLKNLCETLLDFDIRRNILVYGKDKANDMFLEFVLKEKPEYIFLWAKPDEIYPETLITLKEEYPEIKIFTVLQDDDNDFDSFSRYILLFIDYGLIFQKKYIENYKKEGINRVFYSAGINPEFFKPLKVEKKYDVVFVGYSKGDKSGRYELIKFLKDRGVKIKLFGWGWSNYPEFRDIYGGALDSDKLIEVMNQSKILLNFTKSGAGRPHLTAKLFEGGACGTFVLSEYYDEYKSLFKEGKEIIMFRDNQDLLRKIDYYLNNEKQREKIAKAMRARILKQYDINKELLRIFKEVEKLPPHKITFSDFTEKIIELKKGAMKLSKEKIIEMVKGADYITFNFNNLQKKAYKEYLQIYAIKKSGKPISCGDYYIHSKLIGDYINVLTKSAIDSMGRKDFINLLHFDQLMIKKAFFISNLDIILRDINRPITFIDEFNTAFISFPLLRVKPFRLENLQKMKTGMYFNFLYKLFSLKHQKKLFLSHYPYAFILKILTGDIFILRALMDILRDKDKKGKLNQLMK